MRMYTMKKNKDSLLYNALDLLRTYYEEENPERSFFFLQKIQRRPFVMLSWSS